VKASDGMERPAQQLGLQEGVPLSRQLK